MDKLKEIINLLTPNKIKSIEILDYNASSDSKLMKLYNGILKGKLTDDKTACKQLYPDNNSNAYYKLKHSLRDRLLNTVFFIDVKSSKHSDIHRAKLSVQKTISLIQILLTKGIKKNAIYMASKCLPITDKFEFTHEKLILIRILRRHTATMLGDSKKVQEYDQIIADTMELLNAEVLVEGYFYKILALYVNNKSTKPYVYEQSSNYLKELESKKPSISSANYIYHSAMISIAMHMSINNYKDSLKTCEDALQEITQLRFVHTKSIVNLSSQAIACCIQLKLYERGQKLIMDGLKIMQVGIFNWFKYHELHLTLCLHTKNYQKAWEIFTDVISHKKFKNLNGNVKQIWKIYDAWLNLFISTKHIELPSKEDNKQFRISKFVNEVQTFSKDKRGLNVPILIIQIVLLLHQKKYDTVIDRMETIAKYKDRYVNKTDNFRSNVFIRMLLKIPKENFKKKNVLAATTKEYEKLQEVPLDLANQSEDIEILPYEDVWEVVISELV